MVMCCFLVSHLDQIQIVVDLIFSLNGHLASKKFKIQNVKRKNITFSPLQKGGVHTRGEICPRSDPDIPDMRYYLGPQKLKYDLFLQCTTGYEIWDNFNFPMLNPHWQLCKI